MNVKYNCTSKFNILQCFDITAGAKKAHLDFENPATFIKNSVVRGSGLTRSKSGKEGIKLRLRAVAIVIT